MTRLGRCATAIVWLVAATGCHRAPALVPGPPAVLEMPPAPERVLIPVVLTIPEPPEPAEPAAEPPAAPPSRPRATGATRPADPRPETTAPEAPTPPVLQTAADAPAVERRIQAFIAQAEQDLARVRPAALNASARAQFEQARTFIRMASEATKIKNYLYAEELASKAAAVAGQLARN